MNILILAPHPFYQDRGTPIAVNMILKVLSERGDQIDVVTYYEGREIKYNNVTLHRIPTIPFINHVRPGFSWKKIICDLFMLLKVVRLASRKKYHIIHAVEESVYLALALKWLFKIPYVYDMDSSLPQQIVEKYPSLTPFSSLLNFFEGLSVRNAKAVVPVCDALASIAGRHNPEKLVVLHDVSLLENKGSLGHVSLKKALGIDGLILMYVGNLEAYQGIDLLLESFALASKNASRANLIIIGGEAVDIKKYQAKSDQLGIQQKVHFLGPKPINDLAGYLSEADILISPRIKGKNTPMKLYSYLHSGKAILATDLPTHTQVLDSRVAMLAHPSPEAFSRGMLRLIEDESLRIGFGMAGKMLVEEKFSYISFRGKLNGLFDWLKAEVDQLHGDEVGMVGRFQKRIR